MKPIYIIDKSFMWKFLLKGLLAGVFIAIAGFAYLNHPDIIGAILFSFGLASIILFDLNLFTGKSGSTPFKVENQIMLFMMLILNCLGCFFMALLLSKSYALIHNNSDYMLATIVEHRLYDSSLFNIFILSILTGIIMETAVRSVKLFNNWIPLIIGIPLFIISGMPHCIADFFYYSIGVIYYDIYAPDMAIPWVLSFIGNYIGCNYSKLLPSN